ncbi:MAG: MFS transporter [Promethearchaeota archaeon]
MEQESEVVLHSKMNMVSYGFGKFINEFLNMAFGAYVFFYYETEVNLSIWLTTIGFIIFAIWNAINDPIVGFLVDRPFKFTKNWGRRFPWVFIGGIPWLICYILIFTPPSIDPNTNALLIFFWLIFSTCLYDTFGSIFNVNFYAIFPDKFRNATERRMASTLSTLVGVSGVALGAMIPPLFIKFDNLQSYILQAGVVVIILCMALALSIPGCYEDKVNIENYIENWEKTKEKESFFKILKSILKHKNFMAYIIAYTFYQSLVQSMIGSIPYIADFVLNVKEEDIILIMAGFLLGAFISMPIWAYIANKTDNDRKIIIIAASYLVVATGTLFFIRDYFLLLIFMIIWGFGEGGFWVMMPPVLSSTIDESVIMTNQRREGIYNGIQTFFGRAAFVAQALSFSIVHSLTGFQQDSPTQSPLAIMGIELHFSIIPMIFMLIAVIILWRFYTITPSKAKEIKERLAELKL